MAKTGAVIVFALLSLIALTTHFTIQSLPSSDQAESSRSLPLLHVRASFVLQTHSTLLRLFMASRPKPGIIATIHDIAIVQASVPAKASVGSIVVVDSTVVNFGTVTEQPVVQLIVNGTLVGEDAGIIIPSHSAAISRIGWDTINDSPGNYSLVVEALPVQGEQVLTNNFLSAHFVTLINRIPSSPSSPVEPVPGFSREIVLVIAIAETILLSWFVIGRRTLTRLTFLKGSDDS